MMTHVIGIRLTLGTLLSAIVVSAAGCVPGPGGYSRPWRGPGPAGATTRIALVGKQAPKLTGELLTVQDSALLLLCRDEPVRPLVLVPFGVIGQGKIEQPTLRLRDGRAPRPRDVERLRMVSRYPQGVTSELLQRLLEAYGQAELRVLGPAAVAATAPEVVAPDARGPRRIP